MTLRFNIQWHKNKAYYLTHLANKFLFTIHSMVKQHPKRITTTSYNRKICRICHSGRYKLCFMSSQRQHYTRRYNISENGGFATLIC